MWCRSGVLCTKPGVFCCKSGVLYVKPAGVIRQARLVNQVCYVLSHFCKLGALCVNPHV